VNKLTAFLKTPANQLALGVFVSMGGAALSGTMNWTQALPLMAGALVPLVLPDNAAAKEDVENAMAAIEKVARDVAQIRAGK